MIVLGILLGGGIYPEIRCFHTHNLVMAAPGTHASFCHGRVVISGRPFFSFAWLVSLPATWCWLIYESQVLHRTDCHYYTKIILCLMIFLLHSTHLRTQRQKHLVGHVTPSYLPYGKINSCSWQHRVCSFFKTTPVAWNWKGMKTRDQRELETQIKIPTPIWRP